MSKEGPRDIGVDVDKPANPWDGDPNDDVVMDSFDYSRVSMQEIPFNLAKDIIQTI